MKTFTDSEIEEMGYYHCYENDREGEVELIEYLDDSTITFRCRSCGAEENIRLIDVFERICFYGTKFMFEYAKRQDGCASSNNHPLDKMLSLETHDAFITYVLYIDGRMEPIRNERWKLWALENHYCKRFAAADCIMLMIASPMGKSFTVYVKNHWNG